MIEEQLYILQLLPVASHMVKVEGLDVAGTLRIVDEAALGRQRGILFGQVGAATGNLSNFQVPGAPTVKVQNFHLVLGVGS